MSETAFADVDKLLAPISATSRAGVDLKYSPAYDRIKQARKAAEAKPDDHHLWQTVADLTAEALQKESKDLQLAIWLLDAQVRTDGFVGAAAGLTLVRRLLTEYWDDAFPQIDRQDEEPLSARVAILDWLNERLAAHIKTVPLTDRPSGYGVLHYETTQVADATKKKALIAAGWPTLEQFEAEINAASTRFLQETNHEVAQAAEALATLEQYCETGLAKLPQEFGRIEVSFGALRTALETSRWLLNRIVQRRAPETPAAPAYEPSGTPRTPDVVSTAPPEPASADRPSKSRDRETLLRELRTIVQALRDENPRSPLPYLLTRVMAVGRLFASESVSDAQPLPAPPTATRQRLRALFAEQNWFELLEESERELSSREKQVWLDAHRYSIQSLEGLGDYREAATAARAQLRVLIERYPDLMTAELDDGTTAASRETQEWLRTELLDRQASAPAAAVSPRLVEAPVAAGVKTEAAPPDDVWERAMNLVKASKGAQAIALLQSEVDRATSGRERFTRRLRVAEICHAAGNDALAYPIVDELARLCDENRLDQWEEPSLQIRVWTLLYQSARKVESGDAAATARSREAFARLCRLDPTQAMSLERETGSTRFFRR